MSRSLTVALTTLASKRTLLLFAGTAFLGLATLEPAAHAQRVNFNYTGKLVTYTVPKTGSYQILAFGAQGGGEPPVTGPGGSGAEIGGNFNLTEGEVLQIAVGGAGSGLGGGGGSFVVGPGNTPLVIAGGGGGAGVSAFGPGTGQGGLTGPNGGNVANGGTGGNGGGGGSDGGAGGGGFFSAGGNSIPPFPSVPVATGGRAFPDLAGGSVGGGFGGGGGAGGAAGGGGGYSGGGGGFGSPGGRSTGGGGGSFDAGTNQILIADLQTGNGEVVITQVSPEFAGTPGKANCHGQSVSALAKQYGGLNAAASALGFASVKALQDAIEEFCEV